MKKGMVSWEVVTLRGFRKRFRNHEKARELYEAINGRVWLEEYHGNKLVRSESRNA